MRMSLHDPDFYLDDPFPAYRWLRRNAPVYWHEACGWWALSRHEDVRFVSSRPDLFTSTRGIMIPESGGMMQATVALWGLTIELSIWDEAAKTARMRDGQRLATSAIFSVTTGPCSEHTY